MSADDLALQPYQPQPWPQNLRAALDDWTFGCLVPMPPLIWAQYPGLDAVLKVEAPSEDSEGSDNVAGQGAPDPAVGSVAPPDDEAGVSVRPPCDPTQEQSPLLPVENLWPTSNFGRVVCGVVISQTCDVALTGPGKRHPFVQVAPVVQMTELNDNRRMEMERWAVVDRALLAPPWEGTYVADLRLSIPVSKDVLARHQPVRAFPDEQRMLLFADHLATKVGRPALHDFLADDIPKGIGAAIKNSHQDAGWFASVEEILVLALPTRLNPTHATLLVVSSQELDAAAKQRWYDLNETFVKGAQKDGITMGPPRHAVASKLPASEYRAAVRLNVPELRTPPFCA